MNAKNTILLIILYFGIATLLQAQNDTIPQPSVQPVNIETSLGNKGVLINSNYSKSFTPESRFGVFFIGELYGTYKTETQEEENQFMAQTHLTYEFLPNLKLTGGVILNQVDGLRPTIGLQYTLKWKDFLFFVDPRVDLTQSHNLELMGFVEYNHPLKRNWGLYSRIQGLYNHDPQHGFHAFSYLRLRLGTSYKNYRFGIAGNLTTLGPLKTHDNQIGIFVGALFF